MWFPHCFKDKEQHSCPGDPIFSSVTGIGKEAQKQERETEPL